MLIKSSRPLSSKKTTGGVYQSNEDFEIKQNYPVFEKKKSAVKI